MPVLRRGSRGDLVVWAQQHLIAAGSPDLPATGIFGRQTYRAVRQFQSRRGLRADGVLGPAHLARLLRVTPVRVHWAAQEGASGAAFLRLEPGGERPALRLAAGEAKRDRPGPAAVSGARRRLRWARRWP